MVVDHGECLLCGPVQDESWVQVEVTPLGVLQIRNTLLPLNQITTSEREPNHLAIYAPASSSALMNHIRSLMSLDVPNRCTLRHGREIIAHPKVRLCLLLLNFNVR